MKFLADIYVYQGYKHTIFELGLFRIFNRSLGVIEHSPRPSVATTEEKYIKRKI